MDNNQFEQLSSLMRQISDQTNPLRNVIPISFAEWWNIFMERFTQLRVKASTLVHYELTRRHADMLSDKAMTDITTEDIQVVLNCLTNRELFRSAEVTKSCLSVCFKFAITNNRAVSNPVTGTYTPKLYPKKKTEILTEAKKDTLTSHCHSPSRTEYLTARQQVYKDIVLFIYDTGVRRAESLSVVWDDWDGGEQMHIRGTKTAKSDRTIYLPASTIAMLIRRKAERSSNSPLIFLSSKGTILSPRSVLRYTKREIGTTVHSLRHTFATDAAKRNAIPKSLQEHMGHAKFNTTYKHYVQNTEEDMRNLARTTRPCSNTPFINRVLA